MPITFKVAESAIDRNAVFKLRHRVFVEQEQRFDNSVSSSITDIFDSFNETLNIMALKDNELIGSIRVVLDNPVGLPASEHYDFKQRLGPVEGNFACFGWLCTLKEYRSYPGLLIGLIKMAVHEMKKNGAHHLIATLHPPLMRFLERTFNAIRVGDDFNSEELGVPMTPAYLSFDTIPPRSREILGGVSNMILQDSSVRKIFQEGETIIEKGSTGDEAFLILRGSARILPVANDGNVIFPKQENYNRMGRGDLLLPRGEILGELSLLDGGIRTATVIPYSREVDVMVWSKEAFMKQLRGDAEKATNICQLLGSRLRNQIQKEKDIPLPSISTVANTLLDASDEGSKRVNAQWLSRQCGLWREDLPEITEKWQKQNIISMEGGLIKVLNPSALLQNHQD